MKTFAFLALLIAFASARPFQYQEEFTTWKRSFAKQYESEEVENQRQRIWEFNRDYVANHNALAARGKIGFTLEMNVFADLETSEFKEMFNGFMQSSGRSHTGQPHIVNTTVPAAADVDWRKKGAVTEVKNQGHCGSCWSFSATGSMEGQHFLKTGNLVSLSEQQIMDCSTKFGNHGCKGGLMDNAFRYIASVKGDETESEYPYKAEDGICRYEESEAVVKCDGHKDIERFSESELKDAVQNVGPISVAIDAGHKEFQLYKEGVFYLATCSSTKLDHGVLAVGYGTEGSEDYWLVKNSWGPLWGMEGYVMMARNKENNCGIATQASYPTECN